MIDADIETLTPDRAVEKMLIDLAALVEDQALELAAANARIAELEGVTAKTLDDQMKDAGMLTIDQMMQPVNQFQVHAGMTDLAFFEVWLERKAREYATMRIPYELGAKSKDHDLFEWVLAHSSVFHEVLVNYRAALKEQPE